jgi:hypothetical protein
MKPDTTGIKYEEQFEGRRSMYLANIVNILEAAISKLHVEQNVCGMQGPIHS